MGLNKMVDWNGLFKWSMEYQDGTKPSEFKEMKKEDRDWLEAALKQYTYNDTDRLKEIVTLLKEKREAGGEQTPEANEELEALIEELQDIVELHPRNNLNLCMSGGMHELLSLALAHPSEGVRKSVCFLISSVSQTTSRCRSSQARVGL